MKNKEMLKLIFDQNVWNQSTRGCSRCHPLLVAFKRSLPSKQFYQLNIDGRYLVAYNGFMTYRFGIDADTTRKINSWQSGWECADFEVEGVVYVFPTK